MECVEWFLCLVLRVGASTLWPQVWASWTAAVEKTIRYAVKIWATNCRPNPEHPTAPYLLIHIQASPPTQPDLHFPKGTDPPQLHRTHPDCADRNPTQPNTPHHYKLLIGEGNIVSSENVLPNMTRDSLLGDRNWTNRTEQSARESSYSQAGLTRVGLNPSHHCSRFTLDSNIVILDRRLSSPGRTQNPISVPTRRNVNTSWNIWISLLPLHSHLWSTELAPRMSQHYLNDTYHDANQRIYRGRHETSDSLLDACCLLLPAPPVLSFDRRCE